MTSTPTTKPAATGIIDITDDTKDAPQPQPISDPTRRPHEGDEPIVIMTWSNANPERPRPRMGDRNWFLEGLDEHPKSGRTIAFEEWFDTSNWSGTPVHDVQREAWIRRTQELVWWKYQGKFIARQLTANTRDRVKGSGTFRGSQPRAGTIYDECRFVRDVARAACEAGLPADPRAWTTDHITKLRSILSSHKKYVKNHGTVVKRLFDLRAVLSDGGIIDDPMPDGMTVGQFVDHYQSDELFQEAVSPANFSLLMAAALRYITLYAADIIAAKAWKDDLAKQKPRTLPLGMAASVFLKKHGITAAHAAMEEVFTTLGGIPTHTAATGAGRVGEVNWTGIARLARVQPATVSQSDQRAYVEQRLKDGVPLLTGYGSRASGDVVPQISVVELPDGTMGPWRTPWCDTSIDREVSRLRDACLIVILGFTGMRVSEATRLPRKDWRTTWVDQPAITAPLVKTAQGEPFKWWVTPEVTQACEVLQAITPADHKYLLAGKKAHLSAITPTTDDGGTTTRHNTIAAGQALAAFVHHINTSEHFTYAEPELDIAYTIRNGLSEVVAERFGEQVTPHMLRITLATISNFAVFGTVAMQQQFKHALHSQTVSYANNNAQNDWEQALVVGRARASAGLLTQIMGDEYAGEEPQFSGPGARRFLKDWKRLLAQAKQSGRLPDFDPDSGNDAVDQLISHAKDDPAILGFITAQSSALHLGESNHCLLLLQKALCEGGRTGIPELTGGGCWENCPNVFLDPGQGEAWKRMWQDIDKALRQELPDVQRARLKARQSVYARALQELTSFTSQEPL